VSHQVCQTKLEDFMLLKLDEIVLQKEPEHCCPVPTTARAAHGRSLSPISPGKAQFLQRKQNLIIQSQQKGTHTLRKHCLHNTWQALEQYPPAG
jgi:hypothetical protein